MFGFGKEFPIGCEEVYKAEQFRLHTVRVISAINSSLEMLQNSTLEELMVVLKELGVRHAEYEAKKEHYVLVGKALIMTLETALGELWNDELKDAWVEIYNIIQSTMLQGAEEYFGSPTTNDEEKKDEQQAANGKSKSTAGLSSVEIVQQNWSTIKIQISEYERVIGGLLFRKLFAKVPNVQNLFGFGRELPLGSEEIYKLERFERHASSVVKAIDKSIKLLRPNNNVTYAKSYLFELGAIHAEYQPTEEQYDLFAECFVEVIQELLVPKSKDSSNDNSDDDESSFTIVESKAWIEVFDMIKVTMLEGSTSFVSDHGK